MLFVSNVFMTFAWYGQLKFPSTPLWLVVLVSWGIAFVEYCFAVPANRIGHSVYSTAQLKTLQEIITLLVFRGFFGDLSGSTRCAGITRWRSPSCAGRRSLFLSQIQLRVFSGSVVRLGHNTAIGSFRPHLFL